MSIASITSAFIEAAEKLRFRFVPDFSVKLPCGKVVQTLGLVSDFGSKKGALIFAESAELSSEVRTELRQLGYFEAILFGTYERYQESHFKATLNDWQFFGCASDRPDWYTGEKWS